MKGESKIISGALGNYTAMTTGKKIYKKSETGLHKTLDTIRKAGM